MKRSKIDSVRQAFKLREQALERELNRVSREREKQDAQAAQLRELLAQYRDRHRSGQSLDVQQAMLLRRFCDQLSDTLSAHGEVTQRLAQAERIQREAWLGAYRRRLGVDKVIDKRAAALAEDVRRRERRTAPNASRPLGTQLEE